MPGGAGGVTCCRARARIRAAAEERSYSLQLHVNTGAHGGLPARLKQAGVVRTWGAASLAFAVPVRTPNSEL